MSHFTVLVIGQDAPRQLAPFHEFECTGLDDKYIQDVDVTEEKRQEYLEDTSLVLKVPEGSTMIERLDSYRHPVHGVVMSAYNNCFYVPNPDYDSRDVFGPNSERLVRKVPDGYVEMTVPDREFRSFEEWLIYNNDITTVGAKELMALKTALPDSMKYGYALMNDDGSVNKVIRRTNPNRKWDWYVLGGRWSGHFKMKPTVKGIVGEPGTFDNKCPEGFADSAFKSDIDFDGMVEAARAKAEVDFDKYWPLVKDLPRPILWPDIVTHVNAMEAMQERAKSSPADGTVSTETGLVAINALVNVHNFKQAREFYASQPAKKAVEADPELSKWWDCPLEHFGFDRAAYIENQCLTAYSTYAVVYNGEWMAQGEMGWFGCSNDKLTTKEWGIRFVELIRNLPDDTLLSMYDCHI